MTPVRVGGKLNFINGQECDLSVERHALDRAHIVAWVGRNDFFLAGDQRHRAGPPSLHHAIIVFPSEKPKGKTDHARGMTKHPVHGEIGLARIRRAKHRRNTTWLSERRGHSLSGHARRSNR